MSDTGHRVKLDAESHRRVVRALAHGASRRVAAAAANLHEATLHHWLRRGQTPGDEPFASLRRVVKAAEARVQDRLWRAYTSDQHPGRSGLEDGDV